MEFKEKTEIVPLIMECRAGNDSAFEELVALYRPMITGVIYRFSLSEYEAFSEACIGFYRAVMSYDLEQSKVTFGLYARICTERCVIDMLRREGQDVSRYIDDGIDVDSIAVSGGIQSMLENREQMAYFLSVAREELSDFEFEVYRLWMVGYKTADMAELLSSNAKSVDNAKNRMLTKLRRRLKDNG